MFWDEDTKKRRELRYYSAAPSPFVDAQPDSGVSVEHIFFKAGYLFTEKEDIALQQFLAVHPDNGKIFVELKPEQDAAEGNADYELVADAFVAVKALDVDAVLALMYAEMGNDVFTTPYKIIKNDLWVLTDEDPKYVLDLIDNPATQETYIAAQALKFKVVRTTDGGRTIRWGKGQTKVCSVSVDNGPVKGLATYFGTDDGQAAKAKIIEKLKDFD